MNIKRIIGIVPIFILSISIFTSCAKTTKISPINYDITAQEEEIVSYNSSTNKTRTVDDFITPDKIVLYKNGTISTINKNDKLFNDIVRYTTERIGETVDMAKLGFVKKDMDTVKQKEIAIEFVYSKKQILKINTVEKQYISLIFPLSWQYSNLCFLNNNTDVYHGPIGPLKQSSALLELLKK